MDAVRAAWARIDDYDGSGFCFDSSFDSSFGFGSGSSFGSGSGYGSGSGSGFGDGSGFGYGISRYCGEDVYLIDGIYTILDRIRGNAAKGRILMDDLTTKPCYLVKHNGLFAHGNTLREARAALLDKLFDGMPEDERIEAFVAAHTWDKPYPNTDYFDWHHKLTGSCLAGREAFAQNHGVDLSGSMTVEQFIRLTERDYGGGIIRKLRERYGI